MEFLEQEHISPALLDGVRAYRAQYPAEPALQGRIPQPRYHYYGKEVWEAAIAALDFRRAIDVPGYDRVTVAPAARFIGTMNYGYAGTRELNEALTSRFVVIQMPPIAEDGLDRLLGEEFPTLEKKYRGQLVQLFLDLQKKCESAEISSKALDLRGLLDALRLIRRGVSAGTALDMGITNKAFDAYEQSLIRDVIAARIPAKLDRSRLFTD